MRDLDEPVNLSPWLWRDVKPVPVQTCKDGDEWGVMLTLFILMRNRKCQVGRRPYVPLACSSSQPPTWLFHVSFLSHQCFLRCYISYLIKASLDHIAFFNYCPMSLQAPTAELLWGSFLQLLYPQPLFPFSLWLTPIRPLHWQFLLSSHQWPSCCQIQRSFFCLHLTKCISSIWCSYPLRPVRSFLPSLCSQDTHQRLLEPFLLVSSYGATSSSLSTWGSSPGLCPWTSSLISPIPGRLYPFPWFSVYRLITPKFISQS